MRTRHSFLTFPMVLLFLSAEGLWRQEQWPPPTPDSLRGEVTAELKAYYGDFSTRDWKAYASHFWPGAILTTIWIPSGEQSPRVVTVSVDSFVAQAHLGPGSKPVFEERMTAADVRAFRDLAHAWVRYTARFGESDAIMQWAGIDAFTLMKHEGKWKIVSLSYTSEHP